MNLSTGGKAAIERLVAAYGYTTRQALSDRLGISKSTLATRYLRDIFPADWIIQCALETGASLEWLSFGTGEPFPNINPVNSISNSKGVNENVLNDIVAVPKKKILDGKLYDANFYMLDKAIIPSHVSNPIIVMPDDIDVEYLADASHKEISDGLWLVEIEGQANIKELYRIPVGKVSVRPPNGGVGFECGINDLKPIAKCYYYLMTNV